MFTGVVFAAFYTAQLAATLTVKPIQGGNQRTRRLARLPRPAAVLPSPPSRSCGPVREITRNEEAYKALHEKKVDASCSMPPCCLSMRQRENYGIVYPRNNPLSKQINIALLALREDGQHLAAALRQVVCRQVRPPGANWVPPTAHAPGRALPLYVSARANG
jgi:hypothetical protein